MTGAPLTSLLLGEDDDDVAEEGGDCGEGSAANRHHKTGKDNHLCSLGLRHQPTALNLICQSLGAGHTTAETTAAVTAR